jgi:putative DNA primase/helicase
MTQNETSQLHVDGKYQNILLQIQDVDHRAYKDPAIQGQANKLLYAMVDAIDVTNAADEADRIISDVAKHSARLGVGDTVTSGLIDAITKERKAGGGRISVKRVFDKAAAAAKRTSGADRAAPGKVAEGVLDDPEWVNMDEEGKPLSTISNTSAILKSMQIEARLNLMTRKEEYTGGAFDDDQIGNMVLRIISGARSVGYKSNEMIDHLQVITSDNKYHPVAEWLDGAVWDGVSRIDALADTLVSDMPADLKRTLLMRWSVGAIKAATLDTPPPQQGVIVLVGDQGKGKTTWIKSLCPLRGSVADGLELHPSNPDSVRAATSAWIAELGELDGTFKRDIPTLKAFITKDVDTYRMPYAKTAMDYRRRTAYCASVNDDKYLIDHTGNRRWWSIPVTCIEYNTIDMQQYWAEIKAMADYTDHSLTSEELADLNYHNKAMEVIDPFEEAILTTFGRNADDGGRRDPMTTTMIAGKLGYDKPDAKVVRSVGTALKKCGYTTKSVKINGTPIKAYMMPIPIH